MYLSFRSLGLARQRSHTICVPWQHMASDGFSTMVNVAACKEVELKNPSLAGDEGR